MKLSGNTNRKLIDGETGSAIDYDHDTYWRDILTSPDLSLYPVEKNAPGEGSTDQENPGGDQEKPGGDQKKPGGSGDNGSNGNTGSGGSGGNNTSNSSGGTAGNGNNLNQNTGISQTGDASTPLLWAALMLTALATMGTTTLYRRKMK